MIELNKYFLDSIFYCEDIDKCSVNMLKFTRKV